jgi:hypothetical protein
MFSPRPLVLRADPQSWLTGLGISSLVYYLACVASPPPGMSKHFEEVDVSEGESRFGEEPANSTGLERYESGDFKEDDNGLSKRKANTTDVVIQDV